MYRAAWHKRQSGFKQSRAAQAETPFRGALDCFWSSLGCYLVLKQNSQPSIPISNPMITNVKAKKKFIKEQ
jgi:hypothetical protein